MYFTSSSISSKIIIHIFDLVINSFYIFAALIPGLSLAIRRVNDAGKSWTWIFINLIPILGAIWFLVILCQPSIPTA